MEGYCPYCSSHFQKIIHGGPCPHVKAFEYENGYIKRVEFHDGRLEDKNPMIWSLPQWMEKVENKQGIQ